MRIDIGRAVVIVAVLIFYLRLIVLQRERSKQLKHAAELDKSGKPKKKPAQHLIYYSIISQKPLDRLISGLGVVLIVAGIFFYVWVPGIDGLQPYWWIPTTIGILAFSWGFKL